MVGRGTHPALSVWFRISRQTEPGSLKNFRVYRVEELLNRQFLPRVF